MGKQMRRSGRWRAPLWASALGRLPPHVAGVFITSLMDWKLLYVLRKARDGENNLVPLCLAYAVLAPTQPRWCHNEAVMGHFSLGIEFSHIWLFLGLLGLLAYQNYRMKWKKIQYLASQMRVTSKVFDKRLIVGEKGGWILSPLSQLNEKTRNIL